ncbi:GlcG/HbpS family heme-binding protein [Aeromicrobium ginsengisoli]|uniref:Heme-binding protein n=1 Tax=Aeromicrobium ginsengisoli TaxID=363867 RepID=A0A5M4FF73_9ACTN|nr:heme-binding protein [Aeromicrobium ginsengisoli]KAA1397766.1 heme-binding protein [Aeromicrobium ginsengisoli]
MTSTMTQSVLTTSGADAICAAAAARADELSVNVSIAVLDTAGVMKAFTRLDGAPMASVSVAQDKAFCAASTSTPTKAWTDIATADPVFGAGLPSLPRFTLLFGGVPITVDGTVVGAVGISGGSNDQDEDIAQAGVAALAG